MRIVRWLDEYLEEMCLLFLLCTMMAVMGVQIAARYAFGASLSWSEEITRFCFIISGFLSASFCIKRSASVKIDQLVSMLPVKAMHVLRLLSYLMELTFFAYLIPFSWKYVSSAAESGQLSPACGIPMYFIQGAAVISFILCVIRLIQKSVERVSMLIRCSRGETVKEVD